MNDSKGAEEETHPLTWDDFEDITWNDLKKIVVPNKKAKEPNSTPASFSNEKVENQARETTKGYLNDLHRKAYEGKIKQREKIVKNIVWLAWISLAAFLLVIGVHMVVRYFWNSEYQGISDETIKVMATGIFTEILAVIVTLCGYLWKDPKD